MLTTGDNIYAAKQLARHPDRRDRRRRRRLVLHLLPAVSLRASTASRSIRRSATTTPRESEEHDDRAQVEDNFYLRERIAGEEAAGRASFGPGLFYRFRVRIATSSSSASTRRRRISSAATGCSNFRSTGSSWSVRSRPRPAASAGAFRSAHHPPFSAGPQHHNTREHGARCCRCSTRSGVAAMFSGHEHNFQHSNAGRHRLLRHRRRGASSATHAPRRFEEAHTVLLERSLPFFVMPG